MTDSDRGLQETFWALEIDFSLFQFLNLIIVILNNPKVIVLLLVLNRWYLTNCPHEATSYWKPVVQRRPATLLKKGSMTSSCFYS